MRANRINIRKSCPGRFIVGLTGGVACGKSTVLKIFGRLGARTICSDTLAGQALEKGKPAYMAAVKKFGAGILGKDGALNRSALAAEVFTSPASRRWLENIVHPQVLRSISGMIKKSGPGIIAVDAPLLFEAGLEGFFDLTVTVCADKKDRMKRALARGWSRKDMLARIKAQWPQARKAAAADTVIDNTGSMRQLRDRAERLFAALKTMNRKK
ncbi:MAG: dephospho-CoA kinase [bacterium]